MSLGWISIGWDRPWALWGLALLPVAWYWLSKQPTLQKRFTGSADFWPGMDASRAARPKRRYWPRHLAEWFAALCALLALAGPKPLDAGRAGPLRVVVDRSPSMYLPFLSGGSGVDSRQAKTRMERALELLQEQSLPRPLQWVDGRTGETISGGPPAGRRSRAGSREAAGGELAWDAKDEMVWVPWDQENMVWLTDDFPGNLPRRAGVLASGGAAVPGSISLTPRGAWAWELDGTVTEVERAPQRLTGGVGWPGAALELAREWALARGIAPELGSEPAEGGALHLVSLREVSADGGDASMAPPTPFVLNTREGTLRGEEWIGGLREGPDGQAAAAHTWWQDGDSGRALLWGGPGRMATRVASWDLSEADPEAWALNLARAFDQLRLNPTDVVSKKERQAAKAGWQPPRGLRPELNGESPSPWTPWLILSSVLCLLAGWGAGVTRPG